MRKVMREIWDNIKLWWPKLIIFVGALLIALGIGWPIYIVSINKSDIGTTLPSLYILGGTFLLGWGFYLKGAGNSGKKLSGYGHFMLGLATLITLPQAPEMLKHILQIEKGVDALVAIKQHYDGEAKTQPLSYLRESSNKDDMKSRITALVRSENATPAECSQESWKGSVSVKNRAPIPGTAYLPEVKAKRIIKTLEGDTPFDKNAITAMVQENLEVWHPKTYPPKCDAYKLK